MADIFDRCVNFRDQQRMGTREELAVAERVLFDTSPIENAGPWIEQDGRKILQFSTNDYLGISVHPEVRRVAAETVKKLTEEGAAKRGLSESQYLDTTG